MSGTQVNLSAMGVDALLKLRDDVGRVLNSRTAELRQQVARLESGNRGSSTARRASNGRSLKGVKLPAKYRDPKDPSSVWAGRGARPRWMQERIKAGAKQDDFLIAKSGKAALARTKRVAKKNGPGRKTG